jgi:hypothetical protein
MKAEKIPSIRSWLERWIWVYDLFGFIILSNIFKYHLVTGTYFPEWASILSLKSWQSFFVDKGAAPIVGVGIIAIFYLGKSFAKSSIDMLASLFSCDRLPQDIGILSDFAKFTVMLIGNFVIFVFLEAVLIYPFLVCAGFLVLYSFYLFKNSSDRKILKDVLSDPVFYPDPNDPHRTFIERRREVAQQYLFDKPHTAREFIVVIAALLGLASILAQHLDRFPYGNEIAYVALSLGIILNEFIVSRWRGVIGRTFDMINNEQVADDVKRANERRSALAQANRRSPNSD